MSKTARSDWAASTPWSGITGKPPTPGSVTDIGQLTGDGYSSGQIPSFDAATGRFVPATPGPSPPPPPGPVPLPTEIWVVWNPPGLNPLQTATEDFDLIGALVSQPVIVGAPFDLQFMTICAYIPASNVVRICLTNMGILPVDFDSGTWRIRIFP